jgi:DNA-binding NarL/FixJ family response regulator
MAVTVRVLIGDDHVVVLEGLRRILQEHFEVVGTATDGRELVEAVKRLEPDVVLTDISMPMLNGIEATRQIHSALPKTKIIMLTQNVDRDYARAAFEAGAGGYVAKQSAVTELVDAVRHVVAGDYYISPLLRDKGINSPVERKVNPRELFGASLTPRQREVLQLVAEGKSGKEIAYILNVSVKTVDFHKADIMQRLGLHSTAELTRYALEHGIAERRS